MAIYETMHSLGIVHNTTETQLDSILIDADLGIHIIDFQHACLRGDESHEFDFAADLERRRLEYLLDVDGARLSEETRTRVPGRTEPWLRDYKRNLLQHAELSRDRILHPRLRKETFDDALLRFWELVWEADYEVISQAARDALGLRPQTPLSSYRTPNFDDAPFVGATPGQPPTVPNTPLVEPETIDETFALVGSHSSSQGERYPRHAPSIPVQSAATEVVIPSFSPLPVNSAPGDATEQDIPAEFSNPKRKKEPSSVTRISTAGRGVSRRTTPQMQPGKGRDLKRERALLIASPSSLDDVDISASGTKETCFPTSDAVSRGKRKAVDVEDIDDVALTQGSAVSKTNKTYAKRRKST